MALLGRHIPTYTSLVLLALSSIALAFPTDSPSPTNTTTPAISPPRVDLFMSNFCLTFDKSGKYTNVKFTVNETVYANSACGGSDITFDCSGPTVIQNEWQVCNTVTGKDTTWQYHSYYNGGRIITELRHTLVCGNNTIGTWEIGGTFFTTAESKCNPPYALAGGSRAPLTTNPSLGALTGVNATYPEDQNFPSGGAENATTTTANVTIAKF